MAMWDCRTGLSYDVNRVSFLRETYLAERRASLQALYDDEEPIDVAKLMAPLPRAITPSYTSLASQKRLAPLEKVPSLPNPAPEMSQLTTSQMAFRSLHHRSVLII